MLYLFMKTSRGAFSTGCLYLVILLVSYLPTHQANAQSTPRWIIHKFPAHRTELTQEHRSELTDIGNKIVAERLGCIRFIGHAATWRGISKDEYARRALVRAETAAEELSVRLEVLGLIARIFGPDDDLTIEDDNSCDKIDGIDVIMMIDEGADNAPIKPNLIGSSSSQARANRALNRRVEIFVDSVIVPAPIVVNPPDSGVGICVNEPGAVCINILNGALQGKRCWHPGNFWSSSQSLDDMVEEGEAEYVCDSR